MSGWRGRQGILHDFVSLAGSFLVVGPDNPYWHSKRKKDGKKRDALQEHRPSVELSFVPPRREWRIFEERRGERVLPRV